ncbi:MAG TPA: oligopeptidase B, partial [Nocardioides sp.]|nr:oligopeptidase B [Nocardioides sp.]
MTSPPEAPRRPHQHTEHGVVRDDPYHWLRDAGASEVLAHLAAERRWYDVATGHLSSLTEDLLAETVRRTPATESSVRCERRHFSYYTRVPSGREHLQLLRDLNSRSPDPDTDPQVDSGFDNGSSGHELLLDAGDLAGTSSYVELGLTAVSPDERLLAYSFDVRGDEVYPLRFRDLATGEDLPDEVPRTYYGGAWSASSDAFLYTVHDESYRPFQVRRHRLGTPPESDELVLQEDDPRFELRVRQCRSGRLAVIWAVSPDATEVWTVDLTRSDSSAL